MDTNAPTADKIYVIIRSPDRIYLEGDVRSVTSYNDKGVFDVLPMHANFISLIKQAIVVHKFGHTKETFFVTTGVMKVKGNKITCYVDLVDERIQNAL